MPFLVLCLLLLLSAPAHGQVLRVNSGSYAVAHPLFSYQYESLGETKVLDDNKTELAGAQLEITSRTRALNLYLFGVFSEETNLSYTNGAELASSFAQQSGLSLSAHDLPDALYNEGWSGHLPIPLGDSGLSLRGGARIASDRRDLSNEDYHSHVAVLFYPNLEASARWSFGAFQQAYLGEISDIIPLAQYESTAGEVAWSVGFLHIPGYYDPPVLPYFGLQLASGALLEIELVYPRRLALAARLFPRLGVRLEFEKDTTKYRLASNDTWDSRILELAESSQQLSFDLQLLTNIELSIGAGTVTERKLVLWDSSNAEELATLLPEDTTSSQLGASLIVHF